MHHCQRCRHAVFGDAPDSFCAPCAQMIAEAALEWWRDTGDCHFCHSTPKKHDEDCPLEPVSDTERAPATGAEPT